MTMPIDLSSILTDERIDCASDARSKKRALEALANLLAEGEDAIGQSAAFNALIGRERLGSTAVGHGVAIPHGRLDGLEGVRGAFLRLSEPVDFEAPDGEPVDLLIGLLVPADCGDEHLAVLATIAERVTDPELLQRLRSSDDAGSIMTTFGFPRSAHHATG
jgi:PTS system nitrogen regulatory IIA component